MIPRNLLFLFLTSVLASGLTQATPDAGSLERDVKEPRSTQQPSRDTPLISAPHNQPAEKTGAQVLVHTFTFNGNTLFSDDELKRALAAYLERKLNFSQVNAAARTIADYYRLAGRLARTVLPKQDVTEGVITIQIIEANFAGAHIKKSASIKRIDPNSIAEIIHAGSPLNQRINTRALERSLLLANDLPGIFVSGALRAGEQPAETVLQLSLTDEPLFSGEAGINNYGSKATGNERLWVSLNLNSPSKRGDRFITHLIRSRGSDYLQMSYSLPVAQPGFRLGASVAYLDYELVSDEFKALDARGDFRSFGFNASYPLIRSHQQNLSLSLDLVHKKYSNESLSTIQSDYSINGLTLGLTGSVRDGIAGGGINTANMALTLGDVNLSTLEGGEDAGLAGRFNKLTLGVNRLQSVANNTELLALATTQLADRHLDSSERFYLGGADDVHAYPNSEASGSRGWRIGVELRRRLPKNVMLSGLYDIGRVYNKNSSPNYGLKGVGIKVNWQHTKGLKAEAVWSRRIGNNPNPTATGSDQDGSLKKNRFWFSLSWAF